MVDMENIEDDDDDIEEMSPEEQDAYETMLSALRSHIFGGAEEGIRAQLRQSQDVAQDVGSMTLALVMEASKQAGEAGIETGFDFLIAIATEVIDDLLDIADAMGIVDGVTDDDREKAMFSAIQSYLMSAEVPPEEQEIAKQQLAELNESGEVERVAQHVRERAIREEGVDPFADGMQVPQRPGLMQG